MKNILLTPLLGSVLLLTGCVGMNSDFTCNETVQDQCMTMEQANSKARFKQEGAGAIKGKPVSPVTLPAVVNPQPSSVPVTSRMAPATHSSSLLKTPAVPSTTHAQANAVTQVTPPVTTFRPSVAPQAVTVYRDTYSDIGMIPPIRQNASTSRLWVAAWVDEHDTYHQPSVVSFVVTPSHWAGAGAPQ
ncbi:type IV conjugative transfer system lipoprotein TraV [Yersinia pekkanenii]|uniref:Conjugal transfer protein TraV n=1 Tax=Yersinia pekkanenii TaxID=1288385 RepID=A0A0T9R1M1_9GAMM|nr:type IV conjugative transfer system lipoprotein TraV [Yersinia pekkanenii]CNI39921.1 conjugal transfer protein TraV [Yersinia pekkanenii]CRY69112.1 conjugal transfer protein TraV [Yersinia pekkanenii]